MFFFSLQAMRSPRIIVALLLPGFLWAEDFPEVYNSEKNQTGEPMPAEAAAKAFQVPEGVEVTVFAAEPEVRNPIALSWDHRGRMWVAENYTYAERGKRFDLALRDRVVIFEDADRDGKAEKRTVFADDLQMLTSVEVEPGGVWVMCPPRLLFIPDRNHDDVPDGDPEVVLDGFTVARSNYHNFANGLRWGPDGWLYGRCGGSCPGEIGAPGTPKAERIPLRGGIWRYHPKRKFFEVIVHGTTNPWGHDWNEHGEGFFINTVNGHLWHMIPGARLDRPFGRSVNPLVYEAIQSHADHWHFDTTGSWTKSRNGAANEFGGGHAHIGMCIYQGDHFPKEWQGKLLTWSQHGRRLNRERLERQGSGYVARHEPDQFLAGDEWFRGLEIRPGPDGALYGLDWSDTGECHDHTGVHRTSGRIYRFSWGRAGDYFEPVTETSELADRAFDSNPWGWQQLRQRLASGKGEGEVTLGRIDGDPTTQRLRELWLKKAAHQLDRQTLEKLLSDHDEHLRIWALRLLTDEWPIDSVYGPMPHRTPPSEPELRDRFVEMAKSDSSGLVRLALASTLQRMPREDRPALAAALASRPEDAHDHNLPKLIWFGLMTLEEGKLQVAEKTDWPDLLRYLARSGVDDPKMVERVVTLASANIQKSGPLLTGLLEGFKGRQKAPQPASWEKHSAALQERHPGPVRALSALFGSGRALASLKAIALDGEEAITVRRKALESLIEARADGLRPLCEKLMRVRGLGEVVVRGLTLFDDPALGKRLVEGYPKLRRREDQAAVISGLVKRPAWAAFLLAAMKEGAIAREALTPFQARQILAMKDEKLARELREVWGEVRQTDEALEKKIAMLAKSLTPDEIAAGNKPRGRVLFETFCTSCHRLYGEGGRLGPDLTGSGRADLGYLLENIVAPNAVVPVDYQMSLVTLQDGRVLGGVVAASDDRTLSLRTPTDELVLEKSAIANRKVLPDSLMPPGLLDSLSPEEIRDLIAYLMHPQQVALPDEKR